MLNKLVRPTTIVGIKRLATQIKKSKGIKHCQALDLASQAAGFENYKHAQKSVNQSGRVARFYPVYITQYWRDQDTYKIGRETHLIQLSKPLLNICKKTELNLVRGLGASRLVSADHLVSDVLSHSQEFARGQVCKSIRGIRFMEHTGLRPLKRLDEKFHDITYELPNRDHDTDWYDPSSGQLILIDEPYELAPDTSNRTDWAAKHQWYLQKAEWPGIYYPYSCDLYAATDANRGYDFDGLMSRINAISAPMVATDWTGVSAPSHDTFYSPSATTSQDRRRAKSKATVYSLPSKTTMPYEPYSLDISGLQRRKPRGKMPLEIHIKVGLIIKAILQSGEKPFEVNWKLNSIRSTLEDWMSIENRGTLSEDFDVIAVYYDGRNQTNAFVDMANTPKALISLLEDVQEMMKKYYPDCEPLRMQIKAIDRCIKIIDKEVGKSRAA